MKVGDKGRYRGTHSECEVVFVKGNGCFVTSGGDFLPQVHAPTGEEVRSHAGTFDFIPEPKTVRVAVWADIAP